MQFDLGNVMSPERILFTLVLLGFAVGVKMLPSLFFLMRGAGLRKALSAGILLSSRLSLIIVAASIGLEAGFISAEFKDAIVLLAVITCLLGPSGFKLLHRPESSPGKEEGTAKGGPWVGWMRE
jgi:Kef-type K+ transport system membrane component KefB